MGDAFCKHVENEGFFCKKVENVGVFVKKWKMGGIFCKKVDLASTQGALCTVSVFFILHFTYLGGAYAPNAPPAYGSVHKRSNFILRKPRPPQCSLARVPKVTPI